MTVFSAFVHCLPPSVLSLLMRYPLNRDKSKSSDGGINLDRTIKASLKYVDAVRNLKYQGTIFEIPAKQYEVAKLGEAKKDAPLIHVLD